MKLQTSLLLLTSIITAGSASNSRCDKAQNRDGFEKGGNLKKCKVQEKICLESQSDSKNKDETPNGQQKTLECYQFQAYLLTYTPFNFKSLCKRIESDEGRSNCIATFEQYTEECKNVASNMKFASCDALKDLKLELKKSPKPENHSLSREEKMAIREQQKQDRITTSKQDMDDHRCNELTNISEKESCKVNMQLFISEREKCRKNKDRIACKAAKEAKNQLPSRKKDQTREEREAKRQQKRKEKTKQKWPKLNSKGKQNVVAAEVDDFLESQFGGDNKSVDGSPNLVPSSGNHICDTSFSTHKDRAECLNLFIELKKYKNRCKASGDMNGADCLHHAELKEKLPSEMQRKNKNGQN